MVQTYSRRSILGITKTKHKKKHLSSSAFALPPAGESTGGLEKFSSDWNFATAAHLFRRATFGATGAQIREAAGESLDAVMDNLFKKEDLPAEPINFNFENDPNEERDLADSKVRPPVLEQLRQTLETILTHSQTLNESPHLGLHRLDSAGRRE